MKISFRDSKFVVYYYNAPTTMPYNSIPLAVLITNLLSSTVATPFAIPNSLPPIIAETNQEIEAAQLFQQGLQKYRNSQIKEAIQCLEKALFIYQETNNKAKFVDSLNELGIAYFAQGKYQKSKSLHEQSLAISQNIKYKKGESKSLNGLGNDYSFLGQYKKAIELHEQSLVISREIADKEEEIKALNGLGNAYGYLKEYEKALKLYSQSQVIARKTNYFEGEAKSLINIGGIYLQLKQYEKATHFLSQSLITLKKINDKRLEAVALSNLGSLFQQVGRYEEAIDINQKILVIYQNLGNKEGEFTALTGLGISYRNLGQYQKSLDFYQRSLEVAQELKSKHSEAVAFGNLGVSSSFLSQYQQAIGFQNRALNLYRELGLEEGEGLTLGNLGIIYDSLGEYQRALEFYQQSLVISRKLKDRLREGNALNNIGAAYVSLERFTDATSILSQAIEVYEKYLRSGLSDSNKISVFDTYSRSYRLLQMTLVAQNKINDALEVAENVRAKAFAELLASRLSGDSGYSLNVENIKIRDIQRVAREKRATIIEYSVVNSLIYIWVIKPTGEVGFRQVDIKSLGTPSLYNLVVNSRESIGVRGRSSIEISALNNLSERAQRLQQLYRLLIAPVATYLPKDPADLVIVIPQAELFLIPFAALQSSEEKYLIEEHTLSISPSIQVLEQTQKIREQRSKKQYLATTEFLVLGNPTMPKMVLQLGKPAQQLPSLPGAEQEAKSIAQLLNTRAVTGKQATKAMVLTKLAHAQIIHLATHGLLDDFKGQGIPGAIALAPSGNGELNDGLLTANEILNLKLNAELVVLSACDTGRGRITGDGVIGLSRSLITAGVPSVIVSLWSVPDAPTAELMVEFYRNWRDRKMDKAQALRQAMITMMKIHPNPKDWAAFTLIGQAE